MESESRKRARVDTINDQRSPEAASENNSTAQFNLTSPDDALQTHEEWLRLAAQGSQLGLWHWNEVNKELFWDAKTREMFGVSLESEVSLETFYGAIHPDDLDRVKRVWRCELEMGLPYELEFRSLRPDGGVRWIHARGRGYYDPHGKPLSMVGVVFDITERKDSDQEHLVRRQAALEARLRLATIVESSNDAIISQNLRGVIESWNTSAEQMFGFTEEEAIGRPVSMLAPPELQEEQRVLLRKLQDGERVTNLETIRSTKTGRKLDVSITVSPIRNARGEVVGASKIIRDISGRKHAEQLLSRINQRLIEAQEQERIRIGRELHDDIAQRLALIAVQLERIKVDFPDLAPEPRTHIDLIRAQSMEIAKDIQSLSHQLHSAKLEYLGIATATRAFCKELSHHHKVEIDFGSYDVPNPLSNDKSICLYRVMQESLQNAVKHSGVRRFEVRLWGEAGEVHLTVRDSGSGFDIEGALQGEGLGLTSMRERVRLVNGTILIDSKHQTGTVVHVRVPLGPSEMDGRLAS